MKERELHGKSKNLVEVIPEELIKLESDKEVKEIILDVAKIEKREGELSNKEKILDSWIPRTELGRLVKEGKIRTYEEAIATGKKILEPEIIDILLNLESDLLLIGQSKGKFGGGKRRAWRQTQKKTMEENVITFSCMAVVGDKEGHVGIGMGRAKETLPARDKAYRNAKLNIISVERGFEEKEDKINEPHTVPFIVEGKCGSVRIKLIPAPRGTGLVIGDEAKKILRLAGIKDVYSKTMGQTRTTFNVAEACIDALIKTTKMKK